ncbi:hypothetical protein [Jatrophihabitans endophyticus]|uniref:hypothetical protein n=1 Tax=Jatrophihabitans endophyticus TaxID=1206085 RepID=UPI0019F74C35|nr:hypothetical protein [Jatrophihabitans endophyticus]MBE7187285.1 hypothetical protein [Jatrophihabitans endophyticus]
MTSPSARRRRRRDPAAAKPEAPTPTTAAAPEPARHKRGSSGRRDHGLRDIAGSGSSQVGVSAALRARAVDRPTDDDLAAAERELTIVRRNWRPPTG